jgi:CTP synthase
MQCAVIEYARNVLNIKDANSREMNERTSDAVIDLMEDQKNVTDMGGTMRLGAYDCKLKKGTNSFDAYANPEVKERHRHRYEFNNEYLETFENAGMKAAGCNPDTGLVEIMEIPEHRWFTGVQFHPEYSSTVLKPHPIFMAFIKAAIQE